MDGENLKNNLLIEEEHKESNINIRKENKSNSITSFKDFNIFRLF